MSDGRADWDGADVIKRAHHFLTRDGLGPLLVKSVAGTAGVSMLGMLFTFLLGWQLARGLGATGYGIYGVAMAAVSILGVPSQFGLPQLLTREVAAAQATADWGRLNGVIRWSARIGIVSSAAIVLLIVLWVVVLGPGIGSALGGSLVIGALLIPCIALGAMASAVLRGVLAVIPAQVTDALIRPLAHSLLLVALLLAGRAITPVSAMGAGVVAAAVAFGVALTLARRRIPEAAKRASPLQHHREWLAAAFPMALTEGLRVVQGQVAILALGTMVDMAEVGQFRVAASLMIAMMFPLSVFNLVVAPHVSSLAAAQDRRRLGKLLNHAALGMTASMLLVLAPFALAGHELIGLVFGYEFAGAAPILLILGAGMLANAVFGPGATALNMLGHPGRVTRAALWSVSLLCALLWPCIVLGGAVGAACAVSVAMLVWSAMLWRDLNRIAGFEVGAWRWWK